MIGEPRDTGPSAIRRFVLPLMIGISIIVGAMLLALWEYNAHQIQDRAEVHAAASRVAHALESSINERLLATDAVAAYALGRDEIEPSEFNTFASNLTIPDREFEGEYLTLLSLQLVPTRSDAYVWPTGTESLVEPPEAADRGFSLVGPVDWNGTSALIGRAPIHLSDVGKTYWGYAATVIDFEETLHSAGLRGDQADDLIIAISRPDLAGVDGEMVSGDRHVSADNPVHVDMYLPGAVWRIWAHPTDGWHTFGDRTETQLILGLAALSALSVAIGLSRWRKARTSATEVTEDLTLLLSAVTGPVIATDSELIITHWNLAAERLTGISNSNAVGIPINEAAIGFQPVAGRSDLAQIALAVELEGETRGLATRVDGLNPRYFDFGISRRNRGGVVCIGIDTTERHETARFAADLTALEQTSTLKDQFLAATSHELRAPLTSILGLTEILIDGTFGALSEKQKISIEQIENSGGHLLSLINQLLDMSKLAAGRLELDREILDLNRLAREALDIIQPVADLRPVRVVSQPSTTPVTVNADRVRVRQIMLNLLSNSVKFTEPGGEIGIEVTSEDAHAFITVWDTGVGIPKSKQHLLFQRFVRIENETGSDGTGLGLSITSELVELHGGSITVESETGVGSRFIISLPLAILTSSQ